MDSTRQFCFVVGLDCRGRVDKGGARVLAWKADIAVVSRGTGVEAKYPGSSSNFFDTPARERIFRERKSPNIKRIMVSTCGGGEIHFKKRVRRRIRKKPVVSPLLYKFIE